MTLDRWPIIDAVFPFYYSSGEKLHTSGRESGRESDRESGKGVHLRWGAAAQF